MKVRNKQDRIFYIILYIMITLLTLSVLYPVIYVISASFSDATRLVQGEMVLWPVGFTLKAYRRIMAYDNIWTGYKNTIFYTVTGTSVNVIVTLMCAYPLSRKNLRGRGIIMKMLTFTMLFGGGMIPGYILVKQLGMMGTRWALIIPGAMSVYNMIVCRTFIESNVPEELWDSAQMDGCNNTYFFFKIVLPLIKPIIAVLALWYGVGHWNSYFGAFLYLDEIEKYPLQIFVKEMLVNAQWSRDTTTYMTTEEILTATEEKNMVVALKYVVIVITSLPVMCVYPFVQKHFRQGVLLGSVKG